MARKYNKDEKFAEVSWCVEDVLTLRPDWSEEKCVEALTRAEGWMQDSMIERGWDVLASECRDMDRESSQPAGDK